MTEIIDLEKFTSSGKIRNLSGRERGKEARKIFKLDRLDCKRTPVEIKIPDSVYAISTSFFCGMFQESYETLGGSEKLREVYKFVIPDKLQPQIMQGLERCASRFKPYMKSEW